MTAKTPGIDVIVVTHGSDLVIQCLEHLAKQTIPHRTLVADNAGDATGLSQAIRERFPDTTLVAMEANLGFGGAVNRLAEISGGEFIVLVNDDMNAEPEFLAEIVAPFANPRVGMVAGMTLQPERGDLVDGFGIEIDATLIAYNRLRHRESGCAPGALLGPSGGAAAYRRSAWEEAKGFEPAFFLYAEDEDLALRLRSKGWEAAEAAGARGVHLGGASAGVDSELQRWNAGFGRGFLLRRFSVLRTWHAPRALIVESLTVIAGLWRGKTLTPVRARAAGWSAGGHATRFPYPYECVDTSISLRETLRRLRHER